MCCWQNTTRMKDIKALLWVIVLTALLLAFSWVEATVLYYHVKPTWHMHVACIQLLVGVLLFLWGIDLKKNSAIVIAAGVGLAMSALFVASAIAQAHLLGL